MARYVGADQGRIVWVGDKEVEGGIKLSEEYNYATDTHVIKYFRYNDGKFIDRKAIKDPKDLKIALVSVWKIPCGISTYSEFLVPELSKVCPKLEIFCEIGEGVEETDTIHPCWKRGQPLDDLIKRIKTYDPDVVLIQHEYGIFPDARHWLSFLSRLYDYKVFVALHSVYAHKDKTICEAAIQNVIVHTNLAKEVLTNRKGINKPVHVIPHGCLPNEQKPRLWNLYRSPHTFMQFGFGFEYKGWENSIEACAILKEKYPDVFFTGLFSESPFSMDLHERYFAKLQKRIQHLGIESNCAFLRGFQTEEVLDSFFRLNKCAVFPYRDNGEHTVYAVTGAARVAMRHGIPTITSSVPFFSDLGGVCPKADTPKDLAAEIEKAWANPKPHVQLQDKFLLENSWTEVALRYAAILTG